MKVKLFIFVAALILGSCQARFINQDEILEEDSLDYVQPMINMPEIVEDESMGYVQPMINMPEIVEDELDASMFIPKLPEMPEMPEMPLEVEPQVEIEPRAGCSVTIRTGLKDKQPLYIEPGTTKFYPFSATGVMNIAAGKTIEMHCTASFASPLSGTTHTATCVSGTTFKINNVQYAWSDIICSSWPAFTAKKSGSTCNGGTTLIHVGFAITSSRFLKQFEVCFNENTEVTRYVYHTLEPGSNYYQTGVDRITFATGGFFNGKNVDKLYTQVTQKETIDKALGYDAAKYFDSSKNVFLARGHMGAKADFVYGTQQRATFLFINAAPQWQVFNAGNWARVEDGVRAWVSKNSKTVDCYTGVYGVTTLPNKSGVQTPLYLAYDANNNGLIPVPKLYYRVVIEPSTKKGIVFIGVNNPHKTLAEIKKDYIICTDVSDKITWLSWQRTDLMAGYSYACEVADFRKTVTHLPTFSVSGLLY